MNNLSHVIGRRDHHRLIVPIDAVDAVRQTDRVRWRLLHNIVEPMSFLVEARGRQLSESRGQCVVAWTCRIVMDCVHIDEGSGPFSGTRLVLHDFVVDLGTLSGPVRRTERESFF